MLLDNNGTHPCSEELKRFNLKFFPQNTTSLIKLMDQGVIERLKMGFHNSTIFRDRQISILDF